VGTINAEICALSADVSFVYAIDVMGTVWRAPQPSGQFSVVSRGDGSYSHPRSLIVDDTYLYWTRHSNGTIVRTRKDGTGPREDLVAGRDGPTQMVLAEGRLYWVEGTFADHDGGGVYSVSVTGGPVTTVAAGQSHPASIAVEGDDVFWFNRYSGSLPLAVKSAPKLGGEVSIIADQRPAIGGDRPTSLYVTKDAVIWSESYSRIVVAPRRGGPIYDLPGVPATGSDLSFGVRGGNVLLQRRDETHNTTQFVQIPLDGGPATILRTLGRPTAPLWYRRFTHGVSATVGSDVYLFVGWGSATETYAGIWRF